MVTTKDTNAADKTVQRNVRIPASTNARIESLCGQTGIDLLGLLRRLCELMAEATTRDEFSRRAHAMIDAAAGTTKPQANTTNRPLASAAEQATAEVFGTPAGGPPPSGTGRGKTQHRKGKVA